MENEERQLVDGYDTAIALLTGVAFTQGFSLLIPIAIGQWLYRHTSVKDSVRGAAVKLLPKVQHLLPMQAMATNNATNASIAVSPLPAMPTNNASNGSIATAGVVSHSTGLMGILQATYHLLLVGHTRGGKTVLLHSLARLLVEQGASVVVLDVDSINGKYPYHCYGAGDNYQAIGIALAGIASEVDKRRRERADDKRVFTPLWVFIDEAHDVFSEVTGSRELAISIVKRGAKLGIHLVIGTQDTQAATLGLQGKMQTLINLTRCDIRNVNGKRTATIDGITYAIPALPDPDSGVVRRASVSEKARIPENNFNALESQRKPLAGISEKATKLPETPESMPASVSEISEMPDEKVDSAIALIDEGLGKNKAIEQVWHCKPGGSKAYVAAIALLKERGY